MQLGQQPLGLSASNLGLCVGADIDYVEVLDKELNKKIISIAKLDLNTTEKRRTAKLRPNLSSTLKKGFKYEPLFTYFSDLEKGAFRIHNDDYVTTDNGTGIVIWHRHLY